MRLIDADALPVHKAYCVDEAGWGANFYVVDKSDIDAAPTIEADPVKRGRWMEIVECKHDGYTDEYWEETYYNCLECDYASDWASPYCPNCWAKMEVDNG